MARPWRWPGRGGGRGRGGGQAVAVRAVAWPRPVRLGSSRASAGLAEENVTYCSRPADRRDGAGPLGPGHRRAACLRCAHGGDREPGDRGAGLRDGRAVWLRTAGPDDVPAIAQLFTDLSPTAFRSRFQAGQATPALATRLASVTEPAGTVCVVAAAAADELAGPAAEPGRLIAEARYVPLGRAAELALTVRDDYQGRPGPDPPGRAGRAGPGVPDRAAAGHRQPQQHRDAAPARTVRVGARRAHRRCSTACLEISATGGMPGWPAGVTGRRVLVEQPGWFDTGRVAELRAAGDNVRQCHGPGGDGPEPARSSPPATAGSRRKRTSSCLSCLRTTGLRGRPRSAPAPLAGAPGPVRAGRVRKPWSRRPGPGRRHTSPPRRPGPADGSGPACLVRDSRVGTAREPAVPGRGTLDRAPLAGPGTGVSMDLELRGRRALITGGSRGIGFAAAEALAAKGVAVGLVARDASGLAAAAERLAGRDPGGHRRRGRHGHRRAQPGGGGGRGRAGRSRPARGQRGGTVGSGNLTSAGPGEFTATFALNAGHAAELIHAGLPHLRQAGGERS